MTATYDPVLCERLCREARELRNEYRFRVGEPKAASDAYAAIRATADQLEAAGREVEQLTALAEFRGRTATDLADELGTVKAERDYWRSQVAVVLSKSCPVQSNECAIRQRCTNKCGQLVDLVTLRTK